MNEVITSAYQFPVSLSQFLFVLYYLCTTTIWIVFLWKQPGIEKFSVECFIVRTVCVVTALLLFSPGIFVLISLIATTLAIAIGGNIYDATGKTTARKKIWGVKIPRHRFHQWFFWLCSDTIFVLTTYIIALLALSVNLDKILWKRLL